MTTITITRETADRYSVTTDTVMADGAFRADHAMRLDGSTLRSHQESGLIRIGGLMRVALGPNTLPRVLALAVGESITLTDNR